MKGNGQGIKHERDVERECSPQQASSDLGTTTDELFVDIQLSLHTQISLESAELASTGLGRGVAVGGRRRSEEASPNHCRLEHRPTIAAVADDRCDVCAGLQGSRMDLQTSMQDGD